MKVLVSGSTGLIGQALIPLLVESGHEVTRLVRGRAKPAQTEVQWDPVAGTLAHQGLEGLDAVVHLAGENVAGRWTKAKKARIRESRVNGTRLVAEALTRLDQPPRVLVSASAIGYYGDRGEEVLTEQSTPGLAFLSDVCQQWEAAAELAARAGIRVVSLRIGFVLSRQGGGLAQMLTPFKLGLGGRIGSGRQYMSWIAIDDLVSIMLFALTHEDLKGPVNAVAPNPVTNLVFTKTLGRVLHRPTIFPVPAFAARLAFGQMADELLLASARVEPAALLKAGYQFRFHTLEPALRHYCALPKH
jgi:uncharacterized protein (TIGR01777 family)